MLNVAFLVKLSPIRKYNPSLCFAQVEFVFAISRVIFKDAKFRYVLLNLDTIVSPLVSDIITTQKNKYAKWKYRIQTEEIRIEIKDLQFSYVSWEIWPVVDPMTM